MKENLEQFRMHLKESAHEMAPLKVWQLQGTGICFTLLKTPFNILVILPMHAQRSYMGMKIK